MAERKKENKERTLLSNIDAVYFSHHNTTYHLPNPIAKAGRNLCWPLETFNIS